MADEQEISAPSELETTPAIAPAAEETEVPQTILDPGEDPDENGQEAGDEDDGDDDIAELDFGFKKYSVPKSLKEGIEALRADYTQKTQGTSERAKALDERETAINKQAEVTEVELEARAALRGVYTELAEYAKLTPSDWAAHARNDPVGTQQHRLRFEALRDQKADLEGKVGQAQQERTEHAQRDLAKRVQETLTAAPTIIPGITAETRGLAIDKLIAFAHSEGISEQALRANWSPSLLKLLHQAHVGAQAIAKQSAPKPANRPPPAPLQTVRSATSPQPSRSLADIARSDDMEAYAAARSGGRKR